MTRGCALTSIQGSINMRFAGNSGTRAALLLTAVLVLNACDQTAGLDSLSDPVIRDMALVSADATIEVINTVKLPFSFGSIPLAAGAEAQAHGHGYGETGGRHGLGHERSGTVEKTFFDEAGIEQAAYDELTTETIHVIAIVEGQRGREGWSATVHRERDMTITGLAGENTHRTLNGSGSSEISRSRHTEDGDRTHEMTGSFTYTDVVIPVPGTEPRWPISGTITRTLNAIRTDAEGNETMREMEMTITFDGTREGRNPLRGRFFGRG